MVFFTCSGCGESLKKAQVQKHRYQCRRSRVVSCIDCNKDFHGDDYQTHTKCVSEGQKYGGQNYVAKANKGEVKQEQWYERVQRAIDSIDLKDARLRSLLEQVKTYPNVPRKQQKFESFLFNSLKVRDQRLIHAAWSAISASVEKEKEKPESNEKADLDRASMKDEATAHAPAADTATNEDGKTRPETTDGRKKRKIGKDTEELVENGRAGKRKRVEPNSDSSPVAQTNGDSAVDEKAGKKKFNWRKAIKRRLISAPEKATKLKNLRKEIINQYNESGKRKDHTEDELSTLFDQALKRLSDAEFLALDGKMVRVVKNC